MVKFKTFVKKLLVMKLEMLKGNYGNVLDIEWENLTPESNIIPI